MDALKIMLNSNLEDYLVIDEKNIISGIVNRNDIIAQMLFESMD
jgi:predicted transcriptional regulator